MKKPTYRKITVEVTVKTSFEDDAEEVEISEVKVDGKVVEEMSREWKLGDAHDWEIWSSQFCGLSLEFAYW